MNKKKCPVCKRDHTIKYGIRKGVQLYLCKDCGYQFRTGTEVSNDELWTVYQQEKQTIKELSARFHMSVATVKRRLRDIKREWVQPPLSGGGFVHLDVTYWGRNFGVLLALDSETGKPLYVAFVKSEAYSSFCRLKSLDLPKSFIAYSLFNINIPRDFAMPKKTQMSEIFITEGSLVSKNTSVYRALREVLACKMSYRSKITAR